MLHAARSVVVGAGVLRAAKAGELAPVARRRVEKRWATRDPTASQAVCHGIQTAKRESKPLSQNGPANLSRKSTPCGKRLARQARHRHQLAWLGRMGSNPTRLTVPRRTVMTVAACREPSRVTISPSRTTQGRRCTRKAKRATLARQASSRPLCVLEGASHTLGARLLARLVVVSAGATVGRCSAAHRTECPLATDVTICLSRHHDAELLRRPTWTW